jgi:hypothetical protein
LLPPLPCFPCLPAHQTWLLFVLLSVFSMAMGFYDLWKNVPYFKQVVVGMFRPAAAVFEWLEGHTQVRAAVRLPGAHSAGDTIFQGGRWRARNCLVSCQCSVLPPVHGSN